MKIRKSFLAVFVLLFLFVTAGPVLADEQARPQPFKQKITSRGITFEVTVPAECTGIKGAEPVSAYPDDMLDVLQFPLDGMSAYHPQVGGHEIAVWFENGTATPLIVSYIIPMYGIGVYWACGDDGSLTECTISEAWEIMVRFMEKEEKIKNQEKPEAI